MESCKKSSKSNLEREKESNEFLLQYPEKLKMNQYWYSAPTIQTIVEEIEQYGSRIACLSTPSVYFSLRNPLIKKSAKLFDFDTQWATDPGFVLFNYKEIEKIPSEYHHAFDYVVIDPPFVTDLVWEKYAQAAKLLLVTGNEGDEPSDTLIDWSKPVRVTTPYGIGHILLPLQFGPTLKSNDNGMFVIELSWGGRSTLNATSVELAMPTRVNTPFGIGKIISPIQFNPSVVIPNQDGMFVVKMSDWCATCCLNGDSVELLRKTPRGKMLLSTIVEHDWYLAELLGVTIQRYRPCIPNLIYQYSFYTNYSSHRLNRYNPEIDPEYL